MLRHPRPHIVLGDHASRSTGTPLHLRSTVDGLGPGNLLQSSQGGVVVRSFSLDMPSCSSGYLSLHRSGTFPLLVLWLHVDASGHNSSLRDDPHSLADSLLFNTETSAFIDSRLGDGRASPFPRFGTDSPGLPPRSRREFSHLSGSRFHHLLPSRLHPRPRSRSLLRSQRPAPLSAWAGLVNSHSKAAQAIVVDFERIGERREDWHLVSWMPR